MWPMSDTYLRVLTNQKTVIVLYRLPMYYCTGGVSAFRMIVWFGFDKQRGELNNYNFNCIANSFILVRVEAYSAPQRSPLRFKSWFIKLCFKFYWHCNALWGWPYIGQLVPLQKWLLSVLLLWNPHLDVGARWRLAAAASSRLTLPWQPMTVQTKTKKLDRTNCPAESWTWLKFRYQSFTVCGSKKTANFVSLIQPSPTGHGDLKKKKKKTAEKKNDSTWK